NCFISCLKIEIQRELALHKPQTIADAIGLARLIESKITDSRRNYNYPRFQPVAPTPALLPTPAPKPAATLPIRRLTQAEMQARRSKGLCFNCDERGADAVLGVQWLQTLGDVIANFSVPRLSFELDGQRIRLVGESRVTEASSQQLQKLVTSGSIASLHTLVFHPTHPSLTLPIEQPMLPPVVQSLLSEFNDLFAVPTDLPPPRPQ
ncbi:hypothetical protein ABTG41_13065, partial [Acinetobacter baumannii]